MNIFFVLIIHFVILSLTSFGGVSASMSEMHRVFVDNLQLINHQKFTELYAISQSAPGPNLLFVVLLGWNIKGVVGAVVSLFSMTIPACILSVTIGQLIFKHKENSWLILLRKILVPITIGLFCSSGVILLKNSIHVASLLLAASTILLLWRYKLNPIWMIVFGALLGAAGIV